MIAQEPNKESDHVNITIEYIHLCFKSSSFSYFNANHYLQFMQFSNFMPQVYMLYVKEFMFM